MSSKSERTFHFLKRIASGGFGTVYLVKISQRDGFNRLVAVKLLHPTWADNTEVASRMRDEARLLGMLRHKNIIDVMDLTLIDNRCAVVMEYLEAVDLRTILEAAEQLKSKVPWRPVLELGAEVASALDAAYNRPPYEGEKPLRVIHRDIKPSNIMIDESGRVKVLDFGVARADFDERESRTQDMAFGSIEYMPPERLFLEPDTSASDVYSLATTLFEVLFGDRLGKARLRPKMQAEFVEERLAELFEVNPVPVQEGVAQLFTDMLAYEGSDRPAAAEVATRLRALARTLDEPALTEWAAELVPQLRQALSTAQSDPGDDPMVGKTLSEDGLSGGAAPTPAPVQPSAPPPPPAGVKAVSAKPGAVGHNTRPPSQASQEPTPARVATPLPVERISPAADVLPDPEPPKRNPLVLVAVVLAVLVVLGLAAAVAAGAGFALLS